MTGSAGKSTQEVTRAAKVESMSEQGGSKAPSKKGNANWIKGGPSPNPTGKRKDAMMPSGARRGHITDGLENVILGFGTSRDRRFHTTFTAERLAFQDTEEMWRGDALAARIIETPVNEMFRKGFELQIQDEKAAAKKDPGESDTPEGMAAKLSVSSDQAAKRARGRTDFFGGTPAPAPTKPPGVIEKPDETPTALSESIIAMLEELGGAARLREGMLYGEAHGGGAVLIGADDGLPLWKPLNLKNIKSVNWLTALHCQELYAEKYYDDPRAPKFGEPMTWVLYPRFVPNGATGNAPGQITIHESRLILFRGVRVSRQQMIANGGWGDSRLVRCHESLRDYRLTWAAAATLMQDFAQAILRIKDLADLVGSAGEDTLKARIRLLELGRSALNTMILDAEESYERQATPITGLPEMIDRSMQRVAADAQQPMTLLFAQSPGGLNATGASDIRFFYDSISARQRAELQPGLEYLLRILMLAKNGPCKGIEPSNWSVVFNPLYEMTDKELAEIRSIQSETDERYVNMTAVTPEEIARSRFGGDKWSPDTKLDYDAREELAAGHEEAEAAYAAEKAKAAEEATKNAPPFGKPGAPAEGDETAKPPAKKAPPFPPKK